VPPTQIELPISVSRRAMALEIPNEVIFNQPNMMAALRLCIRAAGLDDKEVYIPLEIDAGHWSRIVKGDAHFPMNKLCELMDLCGNEVPLIWLANARGKGLVMLKSEADRQVEEANRRARKAEEQVELLTDILQGRAPMKQVQQALLA
jgi:hypothetical protein